MEGKGAHAWSPCTKMASRCSRKRAPKAICALPSLLSVSVDARPSSLSRSSSLNSSENAKLSTGTLSSTASSPTCSPSPVQSTPSTVPSDSEQAFPSHPGGVLEILSRNESLGRNRHTEHVTKKLAEAQ